MSITRKWTLGGIAGLILIFLLGFFLLVNPVRNSASETWDEVAATNEENTRLEAKITQLQQQSAEVPTKLEEIEAVREKMPAEVKQPELVRAIESDASSAGVDLTGITPGEPVEVPNEGAKIVALPMEITATGRYANIKTFVDNLERQERAFLIKTVDVSASGDTADSYTVAVGGDYFTLPEAPLEDAVAEPATPASPAATPAPSAAAAAKNPTQGNKASGTSSKGAKSDSTKSADKNGGDKDTGRGKDSNDGKSNGGKSAN